MTPNLTAPATPKQVDFLRLASDVLTMATVGCAFFAIWRMGVDFGWTNDFVIQDGLLSHWQVWIGATVGFLYLNRRLEAARAAADGD